MIMEEKTVRISKVSFIKFKCLIETNVERNFLLIIQTQYVSCF
jgi:hypothetical protein